MMAAGGSCSSSNGAASRGRQETPIPSGCCSSFFEYETPKVVTVQNVPLGILRFVHHVQPDRMLNITGVNISLYFLDLVNGKVFDFKELECTEEKFRNQADF